MKKLAHYITFLSAISLLFQACGEESPKNSTTTTQTEETKQSLSSEACQKELFNTTISPLLNNCVSCHSQDGQAKSTRLVLQAPLKEHKEANYQILKTFIEETQTLNY